jgi:hypothetical protein
MELRDKKDKAHELAESETLDPDLKVEVDRFVREKTASLCRQARQLALALRKKAARADDVDPAVLAILLLESLRPELKAAAVVEVKEPPQAPPTVPAAA